MTLEVQYNLKSNPNFIRYLRENSHWYKLLNRNPLLFKKFASDVKEEYGLKPASRIAKALETIEVLQNVISSIK